MSSNNFGSFGNSFVLTAGDLGNPRASTDLWAPYMDPVEPVASKNPTAPFDDTFSLDSFHLESSPTYTSPFVLGDAFAASSQQHNSATASSGLVDHAFMPHSLDRDSTGPGMSESEFSEWLRELETKDARDTPPNLWSVEGTGVALTSNEQSGGFNFGLPEGSPGYARSVNTNLGAYDSPARPDFVSILSSGTNPPQRNPSSPPRITAHPYGPALAQRESFYGREHNSYHGRYHGPERHDSYTLPPATAANNSHFPGWSYLDNYRKSQSATQGVSNPSSSSSCTRSPSHSPSQQHVSSALSTSLYPGSRSSEDSPPTQKSGIKIRDIRQYRPGSSSYRKFISISSSSPGPSTPSSTETQRHELPTYAKLQWQAPKVPPSTTHSASVDVFEVQHRQTNDKSFHCPLTVGETRCTATFRGGGRDIKSHLYGHRHVSKEKNIKCFGITSTGEACGGHQFGDNFDVVGHVLAMHCGTMYVSCPLCNVGLVIRKDLRLHQRSDKCKRHRSQKVSLVLS